jgi:hypothetical protein
MDSIRFDKANNHALAVRVCTSDACCQFEFHADKALMKDMRHENFKDFVSYCRFCFENLSCFEYCQKCFFIPIHTHILSIFYSYNFNFK